MAAKKTENTPQRKKRMLDALVKNMGIVTKACKAANVSRSLYYKWLDQDEAFRNEVAAVPEIVTDIVENELMKRIKEGNVPCTIFYMKTKAKDRGYVEKTEQEVTHKGEQFKLTINKNYGESGS